MLSIFWICLGFKGSESKVLPRNHLLIQASASSHRGEYPKNISRPCDPPHLSLVSASLLPCNVCPLLQSTKIFLSISYHHLISRWDSKSCPQPTHSHFLSLSTPEVLMTQAHFTRTKQTHLLLDQFCPSQTGVHLQYRNRRGLVDFITRN